MRGRRFPSQRSLARLWLGSLLLLIVSLAACGSGKQVATTTTACSLVTTDEARQVLGAAVRAQPQEVVSKPKNATVSECLYTAASDSHVARASLALTIAADVASAQQLYNQAKSAALDLSRQTATVSLGDAAFQTQRGSSLGQETLLTVLKDNTVLVVEALSPGHRQLDLEQGLAQIALNRL
ncbi:hypothetical protein [Thermogemmatispora sp.]|uniref:hypothetical protein n=1 Tax=Thermogemmatispora sp. TaxID=1968838 RepID=UPI002ACC17B5|nr:hypothetical protein [Thermogemmatispora sp.]